MKFDVWFEIEKTTKNTVRYQEVDDAGNPSTTPMVGVLYVQKSALGNNFPQALRVTIRSDTPREK